MFTVAGLRLCTTLGQIKIIPNAKKQRPNTKDEKGLYISSSCNPTQKNALTIISHKKTLSLASKTCLANV